jgi:hypothetical protein
MIAKLPEIEKETALLNKIVLVKLYYFFDFNFYHSLFKHRSKSSWDMSDE